jgi:hypothetical protein
MKVFISAAVCALVLCSVGAAAQPAVAKAAVTSSSCQWQFLYQEKVGNPSQYGTIIDWYGAVGQCQYSRKGYNYRTSSWIYY